MYQHLSSKVEDVSSRRASALLLLNTFAGQRPRDRDQIKFLADAMKNGSFRTGDIAIAHFGDREILMNGQHQLNAGVESGVTFRATIERYNCPTDEDLWHLFATFDVHRPRTAKDVMRAARPVLNSVELREVPLRILSNCGTAFLYTGAGTKPNFGSSKRMVSRAVRAELVDQFPEDVLFVAQFAGENEHMLKTAVVTAMIVTHRSNRTKAQEFWDRVIIGDNLEKNSPQYNLRNTILYGISSTKQLGGGRQSLIAMYGTCIAWWNSYISGKQRHLVRAARMSLNNEVPEALTNTESENGKALALTNAD